MKLDDFQQEMLRTGLPIEKNPNRTLSMVGLGLAGEAAKVGLEIGDCVYDERPFDAARRRKVAQEVGDLFWYLARGASLLGKRFSEVCCTDSFRDEKMPLRPSEHIGESMGELKLSFGLMASTGSVADFCKKLVHQDHPFNDTARARFEKHLKDVWLLACALLTALGLTPLEAATLNIQKLRARYPHGFSPWRERSPECR